MNNEYTKRLEYLVNKEKIDILNSKTVMICGAGGVGSFCAEALARSGIKKLILVDFDTIDITNLNRQLMTTKDNINKSKVYALKERLEAISDVIVEVREEFIDENFEIGEVDYVADCIDTLTSKFILNKKCHELNIPILSSMGSAKRLNPSNIKYTTLDKTQNDSLARAFRSLVRKEGYKHKIEVVYCDSLSIQNELNLEGTTSKQKHPLGSAIFVVGSVGLYMAYIICMKLWKEQL